MVEEIKLWIKEHKKIVLIVWVCLILVIIAPLLINTISTLSTDSNTEQDEKSNLTADQQQLINNYDQKTKNTYALLENSKWNDHSGLRACFIKNNQIIERYNEEEQIQDFAICSVEKESKDLTQSKGEFDYHITLLMSDGDYSYITLKRINEGRGENDPLYSASVSGNDAFKNATEYFRLTNSDDFKMSNWNNNANQFFDNKYDEMFKQLKEYCAKNYPQINDLEWNGEITLNYTNNAVSATFKIGTQQSYTIVCTYLKDTGNFEIRRGR